MVGALVFLALALMRMDQPRGREVPSGVRALPAPPIPAAWPAPATGRQCRTDRGRGDGWHRHPAAAEARATPPVSAEAGQLLERPPVRQPVVARRQDLGRRLTVGADVRRACESSVTERRSRALPSSWARMCSCAAGSTDSRSPAVPETQGDQSNRWKRPQQTSYLPSMSATASAWSIAVRPAVTWSGQRGATMFSHRQQHTPREGGGRA